MLEYLEPFIQNTSPRIVPAWIQYVQALETYLRPLYRRHILAPDVSTPGIALLRYILACVDWNYMEHQTSDYERYSYYLRHVRDNLENTFDHNTTGFRFFNTFTSRHLGKVPEFIIPVEDVTTISTLPLDKPWEYWVGVRPVRYLYHDSKELSFDIEKDRVRFYKDPPSYVVISIDVVALAFKWWKYLTSAPLEEEEDMKDQRRFLHKYVISGFYEDQLDIFLLHQLELLSDVSSIDDIEQYTATIVSANNQYGYVGLRYNESCRVMYRELMKINSGNIRPSAICASPLLGYRKSIVQRVHQTLSDLDVPRLRQYQFYRYLRDKGMISFILKLHQYKSQSVIYSRMQKVLKPRVQKAIRERIWDYVKDPIIKADLADELMKLDDGLSYV